MSRGGNGCSASERYKHHVAPIVYSVNFCLTVELATIVVTAVAFNGRACDDCGHGGGTGCVFTVCDDRLSLSQMSAVACGGRKGSGSDDRLQRGVARVSDLMHFCVWLYALSLVATIVVVTI